jgi:hypothetical protein
MSISEHFESHSRKQSKEHFNHLVQIALNDGVIQETEMKVLHKAGKKMGLTEPEIDNLIRNAKKGEFDTPYELSKRFEKLYEIINLISADGKIEPDEIRLARGLAISYGFNDDEIPGLLVLLINGIKNNTDEEELFKVYLKER